MKTNSFVTFISSSNADWSRSRHHMRCLHLPPVPAAKPTMMDTTTLPAFISPINLPNPRRKYRYYHLYATSDENDGCDEVDKSVEMVEAFSHLETLTTEDWDDDSNTKEQIDYSSVLKYSRTDDTPALNFGKSTEEEVRYYLEMQQQLEGTAITEIDDGKLSVDERVSDVDDGVVPDVVEFPWTSINPILRLRGPVATGYGRGGKQLGVPTANLPASLFQSALDGIPNGVYFGWAVIEQATTTIPTTTTTTPTTETILPKGRNIPVKAVVNVGYSPTFEGKENKEKIVEAHMITKNSPMTMPESDAYDGSNSIDDSPTNEIEGDFYGETMRLQLIGYLRAEKKFDSFPDLITQIHRDIGNANWALDSMPFVFSKEDEFVKDGMSDWIGSGGGDDEASWEKEEW